MGDMHSVDGSETRDLQQAQTLKEMRRANWIQIAIVVLMMLGYILHSEGQSQKFEQRFDDSDRAQEQIVHRLDSMQEGLDWLERHTKQ